MKVKEIKGEVVISYEKQYSVGRSAAAMSLLIHMCRINYQETLAPVRVSFWHPEPEETAKYFALFQCPVVFNTGVDSIIFPVSVADKSLSGGNKLLAKLNDQVLIQYLDTFTQDKLISRVKALIVKNLPSGNVSNDMVAGELYFSGSTELYRRLLCLLQTYYDQY